MTKKLYLVFAIHHFGGIRFIGLYRSRRVAMLKKEEFEDFGSFMQPFKLNEDESSYEAVGEVYV
jgi:hypothetical protein